MIKLLLSFMLLQIPNHEAEVQAYVDHFLNTVRRTKGFEARRQRTHKLIPIVVKKSLERGLDPLLIAVFIYRESSWRQEVIGKRGELGLMQVAPHWFREYDLTNVEQQLDAGLGHLRKAIDTCGGDVVQGLNYYGTAPPRCKPILQFAKARYRRYRLAVRRYRQ